MAKEPKRAGRPLFRGLTWQRDTHFSFFRPMDWVPFEWLDGRKGVLFGPDPEDDATLFAVAVQDIGLAVSTEDIPDLYAGFELGIQQMEKSKILTSESWEAGAVIGLEARYTFREKGKRRKRWVRVLYQDTRQITVTAQGATEEEFDYWLPMFNECMMTFRVHSAHGAPTTVEEAINL